MTKVTSIKRFINIVTIRFRLLSLLIALILLFIISSILTPDFLKLNNLINLLVRTSFLLVLSTGMTFIIVGGGIDLSVTSVAVLSHVIIAVILRDYGMSFVFTAIAAGLLSGIFVGAINGIVISRLGVNSFIMTMGMMVITRSVAEILAKGFVRGVPPAFSKVLSDGKIWIFPVLAVIALSVAFISHLILSYTRIGLQIRGVGANSNAADYLGISSRNFRLGLFVFSGFLAGITGIMLVGRLGAANPGILVGFELEAIAAPIIGGATFRGGEGSILGTFIGTIIIGIIANVVILLGVEPYYQQVVSGLVILIAVFIAYSGQRER